MGETQIVERLTSGAAKITRLSPGWYNVGTSIDKHYKRTEFEGHVGEGGWLVCWFLKKLRPLMAKSKLRCNFSVNKT